jgi:hypothetical protein
MALDEMRFTIQNAGWSTLNPSQAYQARKAMKEYRKSHPRCEITGSDKKVQIHHIVPVWSNPAKAACPDNFIALSSSAHIHIIYGHAGSFRNSYVPNVKQIAEKYRAIKQDMIIINREDITTSRLEGKNFFEKMRDFWEYLTAYFYK